MDLKQWHTYAQAVFPALPPSAIVVERLEGGIVNSTVRVTLGCALSDISRDDGESTSASASASASVPSELQRGIRALRVSAATGYTFPTPAPSFVLKHAPDHMPNDPAVPLSQFRQTIEARALAFLAERMAAALAESAVHVPRVVWHDAPRHVLWISDLGRMQTLTSFLSVPTKAALDRQTGRESENETNQQGPDRTPTPSAQAVGVRLGNALAHIHRAAQSPTPEFLAAFTDPAPVGPSMGEYLRDMARTMLRKYGHGDADVLAHRIGLTISAPPEDGLRTWSMVDLWPGSVLLGGTVGEGVAVSAPSTASSGAPEPSTGDFRMALVDWEFAAETHPGSEVGMLLAHLRCHALQVLFAPVADAPDAAEPVDANSAAASASASATTTAEANAPHKATCPPHAPHAHACACSSASSASASASASTSTSASATDINCASYSERIDDVSRGFVDAYCAAGREFVRSPSFARMVLQAYGRELTNNAEFEAAKLSAEGRRQAVAEGAACLRAAGDGDAEVELGLRTLAQVAGTEFLLRLLA